MGKILSVFAITTFLFAGCHGHASALNEDDILLTVDTGTIIKWGDELSAKFRRCPVSRLWQSHDKNEYFASDSLGTNLLLAGNRFVEAYVGNEVHKKTEQEESHTDLTIFIRSAPAKESWPVERVVLTIKQGKVYGVYRFYSSPGQGTPSRTPEVVLAEFDRLKSLIETALAKLCKG